MKKYNIKKFDPCKKALIFYNSFETSEEAWEKCERGDWMLWIAQKLQVDVRKLVLAKSLCAYTVKHLMKDQKSKDAIYVAFLFGRGKATKQELMAAAAYADAAYAAAAYAAAYADAYAAAYAAYAAYAAADAATYAAADAAYAAAYADAYADAAYADTAYADAAYAAAKKENQMKTANICRKILTEEVFKKIKE